MNSLSHKILIDTDAGDDVDDVLAIAFAVLRPELDIKAITTVTLGSVRRAHLIHRLLDTMQRGDIPVAAGMELPLRALSPDELQHLKREYVLNHALPVTAEDENEADAVSLLIRTVEQHPGEITLVTIGPLTNIACALQRKPEIASKIRGIAMMGGEVHLPQKEHNISWDYHASSVVFNSGIPLFMGTWSVTRRFTLMPEECEQIKQQNTPLCRLLGECIDLWWPHKGGKPGPVMYDIAPLIWSYDPTYYPTEPMAIGVETRGEFTTGMTVRRGGTPNVEVSVDIRAEAIKVLYMETVLSSR